MGGDGQVWAEGQIWVSAHSTRLQIPGPTGVLATQGLCGGEGQVETGRSVRENDPPGPGLAPCSAMAWNTTCLSSVN